jgi:hypothetical protein
VLRVDAYPILEENYYNLKLYCEELEEKIEELEDE